MTNEEVENPLATTKKSAITAAVCAAAGTFVSFQGVDTSRSLINGVGSETVVFGPDFGRLTLGVVAALLSVVGLLKLRTLAGLLAAEGAPPAQFTAGQRLYTAALVSIFLFAAWLVYSGLPHTTTTPIG